MEAYEAVVAKIVEILPEMERKLTRPLNKRFSEKISVSTFMLLSMLNSQRLSMGEIASLLDISKQYATQMVDRVIAKGLVERTTDENDRRMIYIVLTDEGRKVIEQCHEWVMDELRRLISQCSEQSLNKLLEEIDAFQVVLSEIKSY